MTIFYAHFAPCLELILDGGVRLRLCHHAHSRRRDFEKVRALLGLSDGQQSVGSAADEVDSGAACGSVPASLSVGVDLFAVVCWCPSFNVFGPALEASAESESVMPGWPVNAADSP